MSYSEYMSSINLLLLTTEVSKKKRLEEKNNLTKIIIKAMFKCLGNDAINSQNPMEFLEKTFNQNQQKK